MKTLVKDLIKKGLPVILLTGKRADKGYKKAIQYLKSNNVRYVCQAFTYSVGNRSELSCKKDGRVF